MKHYAIPSVEEPVLIFNESALENHSAVIAALLRGQPMVLPTAAYAPLLIDNVVNAGYIDHLLAPYAVSEEAIHANAMLGKYCLEDTAVACMLSRFRKYNVRTEFRSDKKTVWVDKHFVDNDNRTIELGNGILAVAETGQAWLNGESVEKKLELYALANAWTPFSDLLNSLIQHVAREFFHQEGHIAGRALEAIARNCVIDSNCFSFFDLEYRSRDPIRKSYFIFRVCYHLFGQNPVLLARSPFENYKEMYEHFCRENGVECDLRRDIDAENNFIKAVASVPRAISVADLTLPFFSSDKARKNSELKKKIRKLRVFLNIGALIIILQAFFCLFVSWI